VVGCHVSATIAHQIRGKSGANQGANQRYLVAHRAAWCVEFGFATPTRTTVFLFLINALQIFEKSA
jgi:hypothetical protein